MSQKFNLQAVADGHKDRFLLTNNGNILCMDNPEGGRLPVAFNSEADAEWFMGLAKEADDIRMDAISNTAAIVPATQMETDSIPSAVYVITKA